MTSSWEGIVDKLDDLAAAKVAGEGLRVRVKTDLGTSTIVYDADAPEAKPNPLTPNVQIVIENSSGEVVSTLGDSPGFSVLKASVVYGSLFAAALIAIKGIKGFVT